MKRRLTKKTESKYLLGMLLSIVKKGMFASTAQPAGKRPKKFSKTLRSTLKRSKLPTLNIGDLVEVVAIDDYHTFGLVVEMPYPAGSGIMVFDLKLGRAIWCIEQELKLLSSVKASKQEQTI